MLKQPLLSATMLTFLTFLIGLVGNHLPYSKTRDAITDALMLPGGFVAGLVYPEGIHTGRGAPGWAVLAMVSNLFVYAAFWYVCLRVIGHFRRKQQHDEPNLPVRRD